MRILFFGSGSPASVTVFETLVRSSSITGVVVPDNKFAAPLVAAARRHGVKTYNFDPQNQNDFAARIDPRPDLICVATFPSILSPNLLEIAPRGGINLHWSLLPRHRGPDPLFWTYLNDDRETGVTVHWLDERADAGPILMQRAIPLDRGRSVVDVYHELSAVAADLAVKSVKSIENATASRTAQDESAATQEPSRNAGTWSIDTAHWQAERVWHVLHGLTIGGAALLRDARGAPFAHGPARAYVTAKHDRPAGTIEAIANGWRVYCADGWVDIDAPPRLSILGRLLKRLRP